MFTVKLIAADGREHEAHVRATSESAAIRHAVRTMQSADPLGAWRPAWVL